MGLWQRQRQSQTPKSVTSRETVKYVEEAHERSEKKEKVKKEKESFMKQAVIKKDRH